MKIVHNHRNRGVLSGRIVVLALVALSLIGTAQVSADSLSVVSDGPYVLRNSDSSFTVLQICRGALVSTIVPTSENITITEPCGDRPLTHVVYPYAIEAPDSLTGIARIFAVSDIHGEYEHLVTLLKRSSIVDEDGHWCWGDGHLVIVGDMFDRGARVTEVLWMLYRLENEAKRVGGSVHVLLGNHEVMVLRGDERYVNEKYLNYIEAKSGRDMKDLFGAASVLGDWLRHKGTVLKINDVLFVHAGMSPALLQQKFDLSQINRSIRSSIDMTAEQLAQDSGVAFLLDSQGPLWYRGYHQAMEGKYPMATPFQLDSILVLYQVKTVVVGHTEVPEIVTLMANRIIGIDVPVEELGSLQGLLWDSGQFYRVDGGGHQHKIE